MKSQLNLLCGTVVLLSLAACKPIDPKVVAQHYQAYAGSYELADADQGYAAMVACPVSLKVQISNDAATLEELMDSPLEKGVQQTKFDESFFKGKSVSKESSCPGGGYRVSDCEDESIHRSESVEVTSENELIITKTYDSNISNSWSHRGGSVSYSSVATKKITLGNDGSILMNKTYRGTGASSSSSTCLYKKQN